MRTILVNNFLREPLLYTFCFFVIGMTVAIMAKFTEDPIASLIKIILNFFSMTMKEVTLRAGVTGFIDLIGVILLFALGMTLCISSFVANIAFGADSKLYGILVFIFLFVWLIISLYWTAQHEKHLRVKRISPHDI